MSWTQKHVISGKKYFRYWNYDVAKAANVTRKNHQTLTGNHYGQLDRKMVFFPTFVLLCDEPIEDFKGKLILLPDERTFYRKFDQWLSLLLETISRYDIMILMI